MFQALLVLEYIRYISMTTLTFYCLRHSTHLCLTHKFHITFFMYLYLLYSQWFMNYFGVACKTNLA